MYPQGGHYPPQPGYAAPQPVYGAPQPGHYPPPQAGYGAPQPHPPNPYGAPPAAPAAHPAYGAAPPPAPAQAHGAPPAAANGVAPVRVRKALLIGINYRGTPHELRGCINDARCMKYLLMTRFQFQESNILMMTDEEPDPLRQPTQFNILQGLRWLVMNAQPGDSLFFHFSGHGGRSRDYAGTEVDGYNETILPLDHKRAGQIVDDTINIIAVQPLGPGVRLHAVFDCCHSGSAMDLPFCSLGKDVYGRTAWEDQRRGIVYKGTRGGEVFMFAGCRDDQTSADTTALSGYAATGAMTYSFIQAIERGQGTTYGSLLLAMRVALQTSPQRFRQIPQLSSTNPFDLDRPFYL